MTLIIVAMMLEATYFNVTILTAFHNLKRGADTLSVNVSGQIPILVLAKSLCRRYWPAMISSLSVLLASFLTIVASGLFTVDNVPQYVGIALAPTESFSSHWTVGSTGHNAKGDTFYTYYDNGTGAAFDQIEWVNGTYPPMTYDELALPNVQLATNDSVELDPSRNSRRVLASLPAFRADLDCDILASDDFNISWAHYVSHTHDEDEDDHHMIVRTPHLLVPEGCIYDKYGALGGATKALDLDIEFSNLPARDRLYAGVMGYLTMNKANCPSLYFAFGNLLWNHTEESELTVMLCRQRLGTVRTNATLQWVQEESRWGLDYTAPPLVTSTSEFGKQIPVNFDITGSFAVNVSSVLSYTQDPTHFFGILLNGRSGIAAHELLGNSNQLQFLHAVKHVYRRYMAQFANLNLRVPKTNGNRDLSSTDIPAQEQTGSEARIVVHKPSRITLQVLLAVLALCVIGIWLVGCDMGSLLPHNPCTIAGVMSLFAASSICEHPRTSGRTSSVEPLRRKSEGSEPSPMKYALGWWGEGQSRRFGIDIGTPRPHRPKQSSPRLAPLPAAAKIKGFLGGWTWRRDGGHGSEKSAQVQYHSLGKYQSYPER